MDKALNTNLPLVSVVMSVYNAEKYLQEAIESILSQSYSDLEFIIVNDGSVDSSLSIIHSFKDSRIHLIDNQGNKGLIYSLNTAFKKASGKYIARMDADDVSLPERLERQVKFMEENPRIGICSCDYWQFSETGSQRYQALSNHDEIFSYMLFNCSVVHPTLMIRKDLIEKQPVLFDSRYPHAEDYELWSRLLFECRFSAVNTVLLKYRLHAQQVTNKHKLTQQLTANHVRANMLKKAGFSYTDDELRVFCLLGNSELIRKFNDLKLLEDFFHKLISQNKHIQAANEAVFEKVLKKHWQDACGLTNTGIKAFFCYLKSNLRDKPTESLVKLFVKCLVRWAKGK